jgi:hypothetical protein
MAYLCLLHPETLVVGLERLPRGKSSKELDHGQQARQKQYLGYQQRARSRY